MGGKGRKVKGRREGEMTRRDESSGEGQRIGRKRERIFLTGPYPQACPMNRMFRLLQTSMRSLYSQRDVYQLSAVEEKIERTLFRVNKVK